MADTLWQLHKQVLEQKRVFLCDNLDFSRHYIFLQCHRILSRDDIEEIQATEYTRRAKVSKMLDKLLLKGPGAFTALCESITNEGTQQFVRDALEEELHILTRSQVFVPEDARQPLDNCSVTQEETLDSSDLPRPGEPGAPALPVQVNYVTTAGTSQV